ncbi:Amidase, conserved site [Sesbania bispinosa]|nr:Amidase, conserved site [Sesbania bispinosa]
MGKKRVMVPAKDVDLSSVKYEPEVIQAPHLTGFVFRLFVRILETPLIGPLILLRNTVIPEEPMFKPEYPPQGLLHCIDIFMCFIAEMEPGVVVLDEDGRPEDRVESALKCLPHYDPAEFLENSASPFRYWKIRDYAYAYRSRKVTPSMKSGKQAAASTQRFEAGNPLSILDGIFMAIKDDIDCYPHPSKGKANMHEFGMGTTGNNPNHGIKRKDRSGKHELSVQLDVRLQVSQIACVVQQDKMEGKEWGELQEILMHQIGTGGSSSGPAAIVASGLCSAALGTDGGGSVRIPSSLCGVVGLKTNYGRTSMEGSLCDSGTVEIIGPIASTVEDVMLVYAAMLGASPANRISLKPSPPCLPTMSFNDDSNALESLRIGKYTPWFNNVHSTEVSDKCEDALNLLSKAHGCEMIEIVIPELLEMRTAHLVSIGSECLCSLNPDCEDGKGVKLTYDTRVSLALFRSFTAADYVAAQCLRRRIMYYFMDIFKKVDVIVTPTTGTTAPRIPPSALGSGETDMQTTGYLMRFVVPANLLGLPAISVPVGYDKEGLPIGLQIIGRPWAEATILRVASAVEKLCGESKKRPVSYYDVLRAN